MVITPIFLLAILSIILLGGLLCSANKNATGTTHLEALLDQNVLVAGGHVVCNHPGGAASGGGPGGRIVSIVKNHAGVESRFGVDGLATNEIKEFAAAASEIFSGAVKIEAELLYRRQRAQRYHGERHAGRNSLDGHGFVKVSCGEVSEAHNILNSVDRTELGVLLSHFSEGGTAGFFGEANRNGSDIQIEPDFGRTCPAMQNESRAQRGMSGEGQFLLHGENAYVDSARLFVGLLRRGRPWEE